MMPVKPTLVEDGDRALFQIYGMGMLFGALTAPDEREARKLWGAHNHLDWRDLKAVEILRS